MNRTPRDYCPTCGSDVLVVSADEGTSHYERAAQSLGPQECAVVLSHAEADALLALLEQANNAGMVPGIGLRVEDAQAAGFKIVGERFRDSDPYNRADRIRAVVWNDPTASAPSHDERKREP